MKSLRGSGDRLRAFDVALFGASVDRPETNARFARRLDLDFPILSDPGKKVARAYGVLRAGLFASRKTIVIDREGRVAHVDEKVSPKTAGEDLAALLANLIA